MEALHHIKDLNTLLDTILADAREFTNADAGSVYLTEGNDLKFSYVQNDTLFKNDLLCNKYIYSNQSIPINKKSLAGYAAATGEPLIIDDAYAIPSDRPYSFNPYFDQISSYKTVSMLIVPMKTSRNETVGVIQLINSKNENNEPVPFSRRHQLFVSQFSYYAGVSIERAIMLRDVVLRMINLSELRDPEETQSHVNRVGSYSVEIYKKWAEQHSVPREEIKNFSDIMRIASILHDVGKVGISDLLLKKQGKLSREEFDTVKMHAIFGARLFQRHNSPWETLAAEITLNHHERWDGTGYPGKISDIFTEPVVFGGGKKGAEIPLSARITAVADVYDALVSRRVYKDPWEEDKALYYIKSNSEKQFDPEIVRIFFDIYDVIKAIREKWA
ncbi:MAG TPA: metal-dependent phosphohydrolase [Spirochaetia bacterium]|nr:metal-dependent phosphohydrolase [Spirochaetia bacterium]